jgi:DNA-binding transcriptional regulator YiaG
MKNITELGGIIRNLRSRQGLTQEQFAIQLDVNFATVNRWENGHSLPSRLARKQIVSQIESLGSEGEDLLSKFRSVCPQ